MSNVYRTVSGSYHRPPSRWAGAVRLAAFGLLGVGVFLLAVWWFRREPAPEAGELAVEEGDDVVATADLRVTAEDTPVVNDIALTAVNGAQASGVAHRSMNEVTFTLTVVAALPPVDTATTAYEAWFVTPGITDFFSLGEMYPREDGKWGLVFEQSTALVRNDIAEFHRVIIIREPRDGNTAPSADHVLNGVFE